MLYCDYWQYLAGSLESSVSWQYGQTSSHSCGMAYLSWEDSHKRQIVSVQYDFRQQVQLMQDGGLIPWAPLFLVSSHFDHLEKSFYLGQRQCTLHTSGSWLKELHWVINFNSRKGWRANILKLAFTETLYGIQAYGNYMIFLHNTHRNIYDIIIDCIGVGVIVRLGNSQLAL